MLRPALVALLLLALSAPSAQAGTVALEPRISADPTGEGCSKYRACDYQAVVFRAGPGEQNRVTVTNAETTIIRDAGASLTAGRGCVGRPDGSVGCSGESLELFLADGDDSADAGRGGKVSGGPGADVITATGSLVADGGPGDDRITGGSLMDFLVGGGGRDRLMGRAGRDLLDDGDHEAGASPDSDIIEGGPGHDTILSYNQRARGVRVDLLARCGGEPGERDRLASVETVLLGKGDDVAIGTARSEAFIGRAGNDILSGRGGRDRLDGQRGDDLLVGGEGRDSLSGGSGRDRLVSRDHSADGVDGGPGADRARVDRLDRVRRVERRS